MKIARLYLLVITMVVFVGGASAHPGHWGASEGKSWSTGFGDCWSASNGGVGSNCGAAPAPAPEPADTVQWYDTDGDGVIDDACPNTPLGVPVNSTGCINDNDGDGVPDYLDKCPETPLGKVVDTNGCAIMVLSLEGVHFATGSHALNSSATSILDKAARTIKAHPSASFTIEGHTDSRASDDFNFRLSERRANSVRDYLISQGVSSSSLSTRGNGESDPVASNETSEGRAANRRVDILAR
jgi:OmpA-OmpF porin, OOP family